MPRTYLSAEARCRQIERFVRQEPGLHTGELAQRVALSYIATKAYLRRLVREGRVRVETEAPAHARGCLQRFYPPVPEPLKKAA